MLQYLTLYCYSVYLTPQLHGTRIHHAARSHADKRSRPDARGRGHSTTTTELSGVAVPERERTRRIPRPFLSTAKAIRSSTGACLSESRGRKIRFRYTHPYHDRAAIRPIHNDSVAARRLPGNGERSRSIDWPAAPDRSGAARSLLSRAAFPDRRVQTD
jgi:hypothetical protein